MSLLDHYQNTLDTLKKQGNYRQLTHNEQHGHWLTVASKCMLNLSSNDYLGLAGQSELKQQFLQQNQSLMTSSSSRLLTGNFDEYTAFEQTLSSAFAGRSALLFNSGYHMNIGILPALANAKTLILADKLVHASMIDGIRLSQAKYVRYKHNDLNHLKQLLEKYHDDADIERILIVTESIFSMDGDEVDLHGLVMLKQQFNKVMLYVDEAHAIGVRGERGLGCAEQYAVIEHIDFLVGTFGKALASVGGYLICDEIIKAYLINTMRPLIFSTALPPINIAWTHFMFERMQGMQKQRQHLQHMGHVLKNEVMSKGYDCLSSSHLVPIIVGESEQAVQKSKQLQALGFYIMPVRPPTVPKHQARLRISLMASISLHELDALVDVL
ncbi:8-amino-7-oxononanoate synthase [Acinetobacter rathckeae]|uniref:8-amino-7-oxononanoate synthase n=1 Tax=Acinetobacter rathckeae TaxID=2605272 RepID=UPI0018A31885|nr:8-amino-7-oxononanoate synthase [Acinetobacter rathckeae]MBF7686703.1 8-amino-7-oxononanoate synthase [Acinetobacter rathckeae]MBF7695764.1 8-amino-7-oxononanoate synthase [Acinetobacter rathckeae]